MSTDAQLPNAVTMDPLDADLLVASVMAAVRASSQDRPSSALLTRNALGVLGVAGAAALAIGGLLVLNPLSSGIGSTPSAPVGPIIVVADEPPFEEPFLEVSDWQTLEGPPSGLPMRYATFESLRDSVRDFMLAGLHAPRGDEGVTIIVPEGAEEATEVHLFIVVHGGANPNTVAHQLRAIARHDARGWWIEPQMEHRVFCDVPLDGGNPYLGRPPSLCY